MAILVGLAGAMAPSLRAEEWPPVDAKKLATEVALFSKLQRVDLGADPEDAMGRLGPRCTLIEAAGEYCRANELYDMRAALPEFCKAQLIIYGGLVRTSGKRPKEGWCVVFRNWQSGDHPMEIYHLALHPTGKKIVFKNDEDRFDYLPKLSLYRCKGIRARGTSWPDHSGWDRHVVVFDQGRPFRDVPTFKQLVGVFRVDPDGMKLLWRRTLDVLPVNFSSELLDRPIWASQPWARTVPAQ